MTFPGRDCSLLISPGAGELIDLKGHTGDIVISITPQFDEVRQHGRDHVARYPTRMTGRFNASALYYGEEAARIREIAANAVLVNGSRALVKMPDGFIGWFCGEVRPEGFVVPEEYSGIVSVTADLPVSGPVLLARIVLPVTVDAAAEAVPNAPALTAAQAAGVWLLIENPAAFDVGKTLTIRVGAENSDAVRVHEGIYALNNVPAGLPTIALSAAPTRGFQATLLVTEPLEVD